MNQNLFRAAMAAQGITQYKLADMLGVAQSTIIRKIKNDSFTIEEAKRIIKILKIKEPEKIFFDDMA